MKKFLSILSLGILLFGNLTQCFANSSFTEEELGNMMLNFLNAEVEKGNTSSDVQEAKSLKTSEIDEEGEDELEDEIEYVGGDKHIIWNKTKGIMTIYTGDFSYGVTIEDKNLGATTVGTGEESYGKYYQYGNNNGTNIGGEITYDLLIRDEKYSKGYNGDITAFIAGPSKLIRSGYQMKSNWGGENDSSSNNYGYDVNNHKVTDPEQRQGPCKKGYHVPSRGEFEELMMIFGNNIGISNDNIMLCKKYHSCNFFSSTDPRSSDDAKSFIDKLNLPFAGQRISSDGSYKNYRGFYRLSTKGESAPITRVNLSNSNDGINYFVNADYTARPGEGFSVRCFKNEYEPYSKTVTFNPNGGSFSGMEVNQTKNYTYTVDENGIVPIYNIQIPDRISKDMSQQSGWMFAGRHTKNGTNDDWGEEFDPYKQNAEIVYAKWLPFNELTINIGNSEIKIIDRNIGAKRIMGTGDYFQWGNNYGFSNGETNYLIHTGTEFISNPNHFNKPWGPGNYYYNNKFVLRENDPYYWYKEINKNLWGGNNNNDKDENMQGPCPKGYHIPRRLEWIATHEIFKKEVSKDNNLCKDFNNKGGSCFAEIFKLPFAGYLKKNDASIEKEGIEGSYWSSTPQYDDVHYRLYITERTIGPEGNDYVTDGGSVRCFKNKNNENKISFKINGEITSEYSFKRWEPITKEYNIKPIVMENAEFVGWYEENSNTKFEFGETEYIEKDKILIPKFECNTGYTKSLDGKSCELIKIIFNANGGKFSNGEQEKNLNITIEGIEKQITKIAHTPNFKENGEFLESLIDGVITGTYGGKQFLFYSPEYREIIKIKGAKSLNINIKYAGSYCGRYNAITPKFIWTGENLDYNNSNAQDAKIIINKAPDNVGEIGEIGLNLSGESLTIYKSSGCPDFGRYATITGTGIINKYYYDKNLLQNLENPKLTGYIFDGRQYNNERFDIDNINTGESLKVYAKWKPLEEKAQESKELVIYTDNTKIKIEGESEQLLTGSTLIEIKSKEVEQYEVKEENDKTTVQESEIQVTSDKTVEYQGGLEVYLEKTTNIGEEKTKERIEGTAKFSSPVAVKIPITSNTEAVKVQVKHEGEDFGYTGLTLNPYNECINGEAVNDKYNGENVGVIEINGEKYALIYTCSASTFVAYTENAKPVVVNESTPTQSAGGGRIISTGGGRIISTTTNKQSTNEPEHSSADAENKSVEQNTTAQTKEITIDSKLQLRSLTRGELAVFSNILLDIFPRLTENKKNVNEVCTEYTDYQEFSSKEQKAVSKLCRLAIMGINEDDKTPLETFGVHNLSTNEEFIKVVNRMTDKYSEEELKDLKSALSSLEENKEENLSFGTVVNIFKKVKNLFE